MPTIAAIGMEVAGWPSETPPTNTTASRPASRYSYEHRLKRAKKINKPSRRTVINGRMKKAHFPVRVSPSTRLPSNARWSLTRHLAFPNEENSISEWTENNSTAVDRPRSNLSIVIPIMKIIMEATSSKMPSQSSSDLDHKSEALVNQTAMKLPHQKFQIQAAELCKRTHAAPIASASRRPHTAPRRI